MKCGNCGNEVQNVSKDLICPMCGRPFKFENITDLVSCVIGHNGLSVISKHDTFSALLRDYAPYLNDDIRLLQIAVDANVFEDLLAVGGENDLQKKNQIAKSVEKLKSVYFLDKNRAASVVTVLTDCLGWNIDFYDGQSNASENKSTAGDGFPQQMSTAANAPTGGKQNNSPINISMGMSVPSPAHKIDPVKRNRIIFAAAVLLIIGLFFLLCSRFSKRNDNNNTVRHTITQQAENTQQTDDSYNGSEDDTSSDDTDETTETSGNTTTEKKPVPATAAPGKLTYTPINVPAIEERTLSIDPITPNVISVGNATILSYSGNLSAEKQCDSYTFESPYNGRCRVDILGMHRGTTVAVYVYDPAGNRIGSATNCTNGDGVTVKDLTAGATYEVRVAQSSGFSSYSLSVGLQKVTTDISGVTELTDSIEYTDQRNVYSFTVPRDGRYRFEISGMQSGTTTELYLFNSLGETVSCNTKCTNGEGLTVKSLKAGDTYNVQVRQASNLSSYKFTIGHQKETVDISDLTYLTDSVEYTDQRNVYSFTVPRDGRYRFEISGMQSGTTTELYLFNSLGETVSCNTKCTNGEGLTVKSLKAGDTYNVQVRQASYLSSYELSIGRQKETVDVATGAKVNDSIEYVDQRNVYSFTADRSGDVRFSVSGMQSGTSVSLYAFNDLGETITSNTNCKNDGGITVKNVTAGTHYEVQIRQNTGISQYTMTVD